MGAIVEVDPIPTGIRQRRQVRISGGYLSSDDIRLHFGLGTTATTADVTVTWPDGERQVFRAVPANRNYLIRRGADPRITE